MDKIGQNGQDLTTYMDKMDTIGQYGKNGKKMEKIGLHGKT